MPPGVSSSVFDTHHGLAWDGPGPVSRVYGLRAVKPRPMRGVFRKGCCLPSPSARYLHNSLLCRRTKRVLCGVPMRTVALPQPDWALRIKPCWTEPRTPYLWAFNYRCSFVKVVYPAVLAVGNGFPATSPGLYSPSVSGKAIQVRGCRLFFGRRENPRAPRTPPLNSDN
jgi:hypothetical protein